MNDQEIINYWLDAGTTVGRARRRFGQRRKRLLWSVTVNSARWVKRAIDVVASAAALIALAPVFAATAGAIKLEDSGPVFFRQQRVGLRGRLFGMWKFRSMVVNAEKLKDQLARENEMQGGVTFKMKHDPRVTRVGRFIRKYSIDELPQFWNVLRGDMSLVGPRPPVPREVALYSPEDRQRLLAVPGLTCFWQVGGRSAIDFAGQVQLDVAYIRSSSIWLDVKLLVQTVPAVLFGKGAF
jgi:exopolysaccharide biosynthesis polyprenyl glycosylphosphotransferase